MLRRPIVIPILAVAAAAAVACGRGRSQDPSIFLDEPNSARNAPALDSVQAMPRPVHLPPPPPGENNGDVSRIRATNAGVSAEGLLEPIFFSYDRSDIRPSQRRTLDRNRDYLVAHPEVAILIEGHCDERGTVEYNFALGDRRATRTRDYLILCGIEPRRIATISKGEEEPAVLGAGEDAWFRNRRGEFKFLN
jgi:peptidoglycan-associated lipoprotein